VETGDVGINIDYCMTCAGQRSVATADLAARKKKRKKKKKRMNGEVT
jgi:hypothetical protein